MRDHWWWRPGVRPGRRVLVWHILFDGQPRVRELVRDFQERVSGVPGLDPVPLDWIHMTTLVAGFTDETTGSAVHGMVEAVHERMRLLAPAEVVLGRPLFHDEGLALGVSPEDGARAVHAGVRAAVGTGEPDWTPHLSVAYSNAEGPKEPLVSALRPPPEPVSARIEAVHLVSQERVGHRYVWERLATVPLGG